MVTYQFRVGTKKFVANPVNLRAPGDGQKIANRVNYTKCFLPRTFLKSDRKRATYVNVSVSLERLFDICVIGYLSNRNAHAVKFKV